MEEKKIYTCQARNDDITFIMEDTYKDGEIVSTEVKGFYYGEPDEEATKQFYGDLKATFDWNN